MRTRTLIAAAALAAGAVLPVAALSGTAGAAGKAADAEVTVVHGIPGVAVDVYVNGSKALSDFTFGTVTKEIALAPGTYKLAVRPHGAKANSKPILSATEKLVAGENATVVANLTTAGKPTLTVFANPTSAVKAGDARVIVRHVADAPAVDLYAGSSKVASDLTNPHEVTLTVPAGTYSIAVKVHDTSTTVIGPASFHFTAGTTTIVYAIGSAARKTLKAVVETY